MGSRFVHGFIEILGSRLSQPFDQNLGKRNVLDEAVDFCPQPVQASGGLVLEPRSGHAVRPVA